VTRSPRAATAIRFLLPASLAAVLYGGPVAAADPDGERMSVAWSAGAIDVIDAVTSGFYSVELRQDGGAWPPTPWLAFEATTHDRFYVFGAKSDISLGRGWLFTPSAGAAIYREHDGLHLGHPLEFRAMAEFSVPVGVYRFGLAVGHYSNAGFGATNRGTEYARLTLIVPLGRKTRGAAPAGGR
jgi:hypothetical protein